jgi:hypothetical protein
VAREIEEKRKRVFQKFEEKRQIFSEQNRKKQEEWDAMTYKQFKDSKEQHYQAVRERCQT